MTSNITEPRERLLNLMGRLGVGVQRFPFGQLRRVLIIASSSRSGSSFLAELLTRSPHFLHFRGEVNPFLRLVGLSHPESGTGSDLLTGKEASSGLLDPFLSWELGKPLAGFFTASAQHRFALDLYGRLILQWPQLEISLEQTRTLLKETLELLQSEHGWTGDNFPNGGLLHAQFLGLLRTHYPSVNPYYYDLERVLLRRQFPDLAKPHGPPPGGFLEEPPFIAIGPWEPAGDLDRILVVKAPSNAYRLEFLCRLFPRKRISILHLTRNPAASINGIYDGWRHYGFFSHYLGEGQLEIENYTDRFPQWGGSWWKFDLPPGWRQWTARPLVEVAGFQWRSAHRSILRFLKQSGLPGFTLKFENLIRDPVLRRQSLGEMMDWLGIDLRGLDRVIAEGLPPIMATHKPRKGRWRARSSLLEPVLEDPETIDVTEELGYHRDRRDWV